MPNSDVSGKEVKGQTGRNEFGRKASLVRNKRKHEDSNTFSLTNGSDTEDPWRRKDEIRLKKERMKGMNGGACVSRFGDLIEKGRPAAVGAADELGCTSTDMKALCCDSHEGPE